MTYHAKLPFCLYQKHFQTPKGVNGQILICQNYCGICRN